MSEFSERFGGKLRDQRTQLIIASILAACVLIAAIIALPSSDDDSADRASDTTTESGDVVDTNADGVPDASATPGTSGSGARGTGSVVAPGDLDDVVKTVPEGGTIKVGIAYLKDPGTANAAAGFGGIGQIDQKRGWDAVIKNINPDLPGGRKIVPLYFPVTTDDITSKGEERLGQEACAHYTQDNHVNVVWEGVVGGDTLETCLTKAKIPSLGGGGGLSYSATYQRYPYLISPTDAAMDRLGAFEVDQLYAQGFFKNFKDNELPYTPQKPADGKARIGLIRYDQPSYKAGATAMKKRLAAHGLSLCSGCEFEISYSADNVQEQLDDATEVNAAIQNCKSRPDGPCTHLMFLGSTAGVRITLFFVDGAEKQQYRPRLGLNPLDAPGAVTSFLGPASYPQFRQSMLVADGPAEFGVRTAAFQACKKLFQDAGESFEGDEAANKEYQIGTFCDAGWYYRAALKATPSPLSTSTFMEGVANMVPVPSAAVYRMQTKTGRRDGSGAIRVGEWADSCNCYKPTTGIIPV